MDNVVSIFKLSVLAKTRREAYRQLRELGFHVTTSVKAAGNGEFICKVVV